VPRDASAVEVSQADRLYRGFPDFSAWGDLPSADSDLWDRFAASLEERRRTATPEALEAAVEVAVRAAALDTGAIEGLYTADRGFTMTVALQSLAWEQAIEERGAGVRELFEAQLEAYELVLDAVTRKLPVTEAWIRALHEKLCAPQKTYRVLTEVGWQEQELPKGEYKTRPNHVRLTDGTFHAYAPVDLVRSEMHRLLEQIRTPEFEAAHPALQASYVHYAFVVIHPFADGNGRVARALASTYFYRAESIPLVIFANQRPAYLDALASADLGEFRPVIEFFRDRGIDTMQLVVESLMTAAGPVPAEVAARVGQRIPELRERRSLSFEEIGNIASLLLREVDLQFQAQMGEISLPDSYHRTFGDEYPERPAPAGYQVAKARNNSIVLELGVQGFPVLVEKTQVTAFFAPPSSTLFPFLLCASENADLLGIRLEDVFPELTPNLRLRISQWVQRRLGEMLQDLENQTRDVPP
jgi:Fic family protein